MNNEESDAPKLSVFTIALIVTAIVAVVFVFLYRFMDLSSQSAGAKVAMITGAFTSFSVIWIAAGIILTQRNLAVYSRELLEQRQEFQIQSQALINMQSSMQLSSYFRLYDHTVARLETLGAYILSSDSELKTICDDFNSLHENEELQNIIHTKLSVPSGFRLREDLKSYTAIYALCKAEANDLPQRDLITKALFQGKRISKNSSVIEVLLSQTKF